MISMSVTILHVADLHLVREGPERDYGLAVLAEIVGLSNELPADYLLLCGDVFDSLADMEALRRPFREALEQVAAQVLFLPGNHEQLGAGRQQLSAFDFGKARLLAARPCELVTLGSGDEPVEFLAIPHQDDYSDYPDWPVPAKQARWRVALAHGVVAGMSYCGPADDEQGGSTLDSDLFSRYQVDYAALGHIHSRPPDFRDDGCLLAYSGSARVWRRGEFGPRGGRLVTLAEEISTRFVDFPSAGCFRSLALPLLPDGTLPGLELPGELHDNDYLEVHLQGLVEDENEVARLGERLQGELAGRVRRLEIDTSGITVLAGAASEPAVRQFLELWENNKPPRDHEDHQMWLRARLLGLEQLKRHLEKAR